MRTFRTRYVVASLILISANLLAGRARSADEPWAWRTGSSFLRQLETPVAFTWQSHALRPALLDLARNQQVAIWLDRRVDPGQPMDIAVGNRSLLAALRYVAEAIGCELSVLDSVIYLGPPETSRKLATLAALRREEVKALPPASRSRFEHSQVWRWEELATPKHLLEELAQEGSIRLYEVDRLPHDLWASGDYPALPLGDRLTLLLAGFEMTYEIARDGTALRPIPIPAEVSIVREHALGTFDETVIAQTLASVPATKFEVRGKKLTVHGTIEVQDQIARLLRGERTPTTAEVREGKKVYDLTVENQPAGAIIKLIAEREKLTIKVSPELVDKLNNQRVSLNVQKASLEQLLERTLKPLGINYRLNGSSLELLPSAEE